MVVVDQDGLQFERCRGWQPAQGRANPRGRAGQSRWQIVERDRTLFIEQTLEQTAGNREEAARILGIGECTLYRDIQEWKLQDKIKQAMSDANGDLAEAAKLLGMKPESLQRKMKKWGMQMPG